MGCISMPILCNAQLVGEVHTLKGRFVLKIFYLVGEVLPLRGILTLLA